MNIEDLLEDGPVDVRQTEQPSCYTLPKCREPKMFGYRRLHTFDQGPCLSFSKTGQLMVNSSGYELAFTSREDLYISMASNELGSAPPVQLQLRSLALSLVQPLEAQIYVQLFLHLGSSFELLQALSGIY